jgi:hypothetical protein
MTFHWTITVLAYPGAWAIGLVCEGALSDREIRAVASRAFGGFIYGLRGITATCKEHPGGVRVIYTVTSETCV